MRGGVSQEDPTSDVLHAVNELQVMRIAITLVAHHGHDAGKAWAKGLTDWEDDADQVRHYTGSVRDNDTLITFAKIKGAPDGWQMAVRYTTQSLPDGGSTKVAASGTRKGHEPGSVKAGAKARAEDAHALILEAASDKVIDDAIAALIAEGRSKLWTQNDLADALAMREELDVSSSTLKRRTLTRLRENKTLKANKLYDPKQKRWRGPNLATPKEITK
jgi:hypothetical protein